MVTLDEVCTSFTIPLSKVETTRFTMKFRVLTQELLFFLGDKFSVPFTVTMHSTEYLTLITLFLIFTQLGGLLNFLGW